MKLQRRRGDLTPIIRVFIQDNSVSTGAGKTGLSSSSTNLVLTAIRELSAAATVYAQSASNIEGITTLGTYAAPTASKIRFKELDATNLPGWYEIHLPLALVDVSDASRFVNLNIREATTTALNISPLPIEIELGAVDHQRVSAKVVDDVANSATTFETNLTSAVNDFYKDSFLCFVTGTLKDQVRRITGYTGATKFVTVDALTAEPTADDAFVLVNI